MKKKLQKAMQFLARPYVASQIKKNGFWFVDVPRTSSSSIKVELSKRFGKVYGKSGLLDKELETSNLIKDHRTAIYIRTLIGHKAWDRIFTFSIVRNPWDRILSLYHYRSRKGSIPTGMAFRDYVIELESSNCGTKGALHYLPAHRYGATDYLLDEDGILLVDFVGRFEDRDQALKTISEKIGHRLPSDAKVQAARPDNKHYSHYYDDETKEVIARVFAKDLATFEYQFEDKR